MLGFFNVPAAELVVVWAWSKDFDAAGYLDGCDFFFLRGIISAGLFNVPVKLGVVSAWSKDFVFEVD